MRMLLSYACRAWPSTALLLLLAGGCARRGEEAGQAPERDAPLTRCTNEAGGYSIAYPQAWVTNTGPAVEPCRFFHPSPFTVEPATEEPSVAVSVKRESVSLERYIEGSTSPSYDVLQQERLTLAGRPAIRLELRATEQSPLLSPGTREYLYVVSAGEEEVIRAATLDVGGLDYARNKEVLDRMIHTLQLR
jgi:hypothetical protein